MVSKHHLTISVDLGLANKVKDKGLNISAICNKALTDAIRDGEDLHAETKEGEDSAHKLTEKENESKDAEKELVENIKRYLPLSESLREILLQVITDKGINKSAEEIEALAYQSLTPAEREAVDLKEKQRAEPKIKQPEPKLPEIIDEDEDDEIDDDEGDGDWDEED